jgi:type VI secretion system protein ImpF
MSDVIAPLERIQPCLLDRLTDDAPDKKEESRMQRVVSLQRYRAGVLRDLEWLFNAIGHYPDEQVGRQKFSDFPEAYRSVVNFGLRQVYGWLAPDVAEIEKEVYDAVTLFEPRINRQTLQVRAAIDRHLLSIEMSGELWANPIPERLFIKTQLDLESSHCITREAGHG